jgi:multimeric flavodoxin WrbA
MNILSICGSRNPKGQTARAVMALLAGVEEAGGSGELVLLPALQIERCRQCEDSGWGLCRAEGHCVIRDDLAPLVERIKAAEAVVFATPVYYGDLSESIRAFLNRMRRVYGHTADKEGVSGKRAVGICVAGGSGGGTPTCAVSLEKVLSNIGFDVVDVIPARRQNLGMKVEVLKAVGTWLARA